MKKVLLMVPCRTVDSRFLEVARIANIFPIGLMYIAAVLEKNNYEVAILDCLTERFEARKDEDGLYRYGLSDEEIAERIESFGPDYIGVSCMFSTNYHDFRQLCKLIRRVSSAPIVGGGPHVSADFESILREGLIDYAVVGEGEYPFLGLLESLEQKAEKKSIPGVAFVGEDGGLEANLKLNRVANLDELPFPAYHLVDFEKYYHAGHSHGDSVANTRWMPIITSRGCPCNCTFCYGTIMGGKKFRYRSAQNVISEILFLKERHRIDEIHIEDDNFCHNPERATEILTELTRIPVRLSFPNGLSLYSLNNDDLVQLLKLNDILSLVVAIESGDDHVLRDLMKKPVDTGLVRTVVEKLKKNRISVKGFFILGMPGESVKTLRNTFNLINDLHLDWIGFNIATPLPGTALARTCLKNGYVDSTRFFEFKDINFARSVIDTPLLSHFQVEKYFYYLNIYCNFIAPINNLATEEEIDYKLFMYKRVKEIAPHHKFADVSHERTNIVKELLHLKENRNVGSKRADELAELNDSLRKQQLRVLEEELSAMKGEIVLFNRLVES